LIAGGLLLIPTAIFWLSLLAYVVFGIRHGLINLFAGLERSPSGLVVVVSIVIGCPLVALPLTALGRWLAKVRDHRGERLGTLILVSSIVFIILGILSPLYPG
jgi:hypothetical protein